MRRAPKRLYVSLAAATALFAADVHALPAISGRVTGVAPAGFPIPQSTVHAFRLYPPYASTSAILPESGGFRLPVQPGPYLVLLDVWKANRSLQRSLKFVNAGRVRLSGGSAGAAQAPGAVVSVGDIRWTDPSGNPRLTSANQPWRFDAMFVTALVGQQAPCDVSVVEDRSFGKYQEILKEIRRRSSRAIAPASRLDLRRAMRVLNAWAPRHRLTGTIVSDSETPSSFDAHLQLVDLKTGQTRWSRDYTLPSDRFFDVPRVVAADVVYDLCSMLPARVQGAFSVESRSPLVGTTQSASGTITYALDEEFRNLPPGTGGFADYHVEAIDWQASTSGGAPCQYVGSAAASLATLEYVGGGMSIEITPEPGLGRQYTLWTSSSTTGPGTLQCEGDALPITLGWNVDLLSPGPWTGALPRMSGRALQGTHAEFDSTWTWSLTAVP